MEHSDPKYFILTVLLFIWNGQGGFSQGLVIGHDQAHLEDLKSIPPEWIDSARTKLRIVYWHTSHGSHITSGMSRLDAFRGDNGVYARAEERLPGVLYLVDYFGDLSDGEDTWPQTTRDYLDDPANQDINVVMWSWCQILGHDGDEDPGYCSKMDSLISEYGPGGSKITSGQRSVPVQFVYMTGHVNGQGEEGRTNQINNYIRNHCIAHERILYDFADIESWDPDDQYFLDDSVSDDCSYLVNGERTGNWAEEWIAGKVMMDGEDDSLHNEPNGGDWFQCTAEHSHPVNANMKAYAAWYMFARLAGWRILVDSLDIKGAGDSTTISTDGGTLQVKAEIFPAGADDTTLTWSVINVTGDATISPSGLLQAVSNGTVTVVATANDGSGITDSLEVVITHQHIPLSSITLAGEGGSSTIDRDSGTLQLYANVLPADATDTTLTWSVINGTGQASISQNGLLEAIRDGTVTVVATANDGSGVSDSLVVTISNQIVLVTAINLWGEGGDTAITRDNGTLQIHALVSPSEADDTTITWSVRNGTGKATVSQTGLLKALYDGTVTVVATANDGSGVKDSLEVAISNQEIVLVSSISLSGTAGSTSISQDQGTLQIIATILPADADDTTLNWSVINQTGKASISDEGLLQADSNGTVTVVATARDSSGVSDSLLITISNQLVLVDSIALFVAGGLPSIDRLGGSLQIQAMVWPTGASDPTVSWSVINGSGQANISQTGLLQAVSDGTVMVVATAHDGSGVKDSLQVTITGQTTNLYDPDDPRLIISTDLSNKLLYVHWKDSPGDHCEVRIFSLTGQQVYVGKVHDSRHRVDLSSLATGYYVLHISKTNHIFTPYKFLVK
jgi:uncharacterized protein YjdB